MGKRLLFWRETVAICQRKLYFVSLQLIHCQSLSDNCKTFGAGGKNLNTK